jgi:cytochrome oxidase Cu insertion factor (SCO1/SenC/PrrC family)
MAAKATRWRSRWWVSLLAAGLSGSALGCADGAQGPAALGGIAFLDQDGRELRASSLAGEVLVLTFMFTSCPSACPRVTQLISEARALLPAEVRGRVRFLSVSVDPDNDTPGALKAFAERQRVDFPDWRFVRVDEHALDLVSKRLLVFEPTLPASPASHTLDLYVFDRAGRLVQRYSGTTTQPERLARELTALHALVRPSAQGGGELPARVLASSSRESQR